MMPNTKSNPLTLKLIFLVMLAMVLSSVQAHAALTQNDVSMLYVSIFNRASEGEGNAFWRSQPGMAAAATAMLETEAAQNYFGSSLNSNQAFIEHIYLNTLNKNPWDDPSGIAHWVGRLDSGSTRGEVVADLVGVIKDYAPGGYITIPMTRLPSPPIINSPTGSRFPITWPIPSRHLPRTGRQRPSSAPAD